MPVEMGVAYLSLDFLLPWRWGVKVVEPGLELLPLDNQRTSLLRQLLDRPESSRERERA